MCFLLSILFIFLLSLSQSSKYKCESDLGVPLTFFNMSSFLDSKPVSVVFFYSRYTAESLNDFQIFCEEAKMKRLDSDSWSFGQVNVTSESELKLLYSIQNVPAFRVFFSGLPVPYTGEMTHGRIRQWIQLRKEGVLTRVNSPEMIHSFVSNSTKNYAFIFIEERPSEESEGFRIAAASLLDAALFLIGPSESIESFIDEKASKDLNENKLKDNKVVFYNEITGNKMILKEKEIAKDQISLNVFNLLENAIFQANIDMLKSYLENSEKSEFNDAKTLIPKVISLNKLNARFLLKKTWSFSGFSERKLTKKWRMRPTCC